MAKMNSSLESLHTDVNQIKVELNTIKELQHSLEYTQAELNDIKDTVNSLKLQQNYKVNLLIPHVSHGEITSS